MKDEQKVQWGKEAMQNGIDNNNIINESIVEGIAENGLKFRGFLSANGEITNFFPLADN